MEDTLTHYGVIGMKWGVRRTPEELGHAPREERKAFKKQLKGNVKEYKRLRQNVTAAQKNVKSRSRAADRDKKDVERAEEVYQKAISKREPVFSKKKRIERQNAIDAAEKYLNNELEFSERSEGKRRQAVKNARKAVDELDKFVSEMNEKYGQVNVKQLKRKDVTTGALWWKKVRMEDGFKTPMNLASAPLIGRTVAARIVNNMEKEDRSELMNERLSDYDRKKYA